MAQLQLQLLVVLNCLAHDVADPRDLVWPPRRHCVCLEDGHSDVTAWSDPAPQQSLATASRG